MIRLTNPLIHDGRVCPAGEMIILDEEFERGRGVFSDLADLFLRQLACQHHLRETHGFEKARLFNGADVGLRSGNPSRTGTGADNPE